METKAYRFEWKTGVRFGSGNLSDSVTSISADTLFSAMCHESLMMFGEKGIERLVEWAREGKLSFTSGLPYVDGKLFIPKPIMPYEFKADTDVKKYKKLKFITVEALDAFLKSELNIAKESEYLKDTTVSEYRTRVKITEGSDATPYGVGCDHFSKNRDTCFIFKGEKEALSEVEEILDSLSTTGVGGKISSGLGKFTLKNAKLTEDFLKRMDLINYTSYMSLSESLPRENEMSDAVKGATYQLIRRGGFVASENFDDVFRKKTEMFFFDIGSVFSQVYSGDVFEVGIGGNHKVYRYGKPLFLGVA